MILVLASRLLSVLIIALVLWGVVVSLRHVCLSTVTARRGGWTMVTVWRLRRRLIPSPHACVRSRRSDAYVLVSDVVWDVDLDVWQVPLYFLFYHALHEDPALTFKLAMTTIDYTQYAFSKCLLYLLYQSTDLGEQFGLDVISKPAICWSGRVAVEL